MKAQRFGWHMAYLAAALMTYLADQASKAWAMRALRFGQAKLLVPGFLALDYAENPGIAFGQLQEGGAFGRWFFVALAALATVAVFYYFFRTPRADDRILGACALLLAGITGNLTDRARLGFVIDFIDVRLGSFHWPTFNLADASICLGALLLVVDLFLEGRQKTVVSSQSPADS